LKNARNQLWEEGKEIDLQIPEKIVSEDKIRNRNLKNLKLKTFVPMHAKITSSSLKMKGNMRSLKKISLKKNFDKEDNITPMPRVDNKGFKGDMFDLDKVIPINL